jgi:hypothetical protein
MTYLWYATCFIRCLADNTRASVARRPSRTMMTIATCLCPSRRS